VELRKCLACRSCELACAKAHAGFEDFVQAVLADAHLVPRVRVVAAAGRAVPLQCQHCEDAPCVTVCPSGALRKDESTGRTLTAPDKCIGCKSCVLVCPFGAASWDTVDRRIVKCDLCEGIIQPGEQPRCIAACPTRARRLMDLTDLVAKRRREVAERTVAVYNLEVAERGTQTSASSAEPNP
jgi:carbon-monoxide dehydrogenase iron sulfur subunit